MVGSLLSPGAVTKSKAVNNRGCAMKNNETNRHDDEGGLVKATGNQVPAAGLRQRLIINGIGGQVPLYGLSGALSVLSPASVTKSTAVNNQGCKMKNNETNGKTKHHKKPCKKKH